MELSELVPSERTIEITNPATDADIGVKVTLMSVNDPRMKRIKNRISDESLRLDAKGKHLKSKDIEENSYEIVFSSMTGWQWDKKVKWNGKENPEFNRKNVFDVLEKLPWFKSQIEEVLNDEKSFFIV